MIVEQIKDEKSGQMKSQIVAKYIGEWKDDK
jgi:hypothetical protein